MTTELTRQYWLHVFDEWANARLSAPQYDEAHAVLKSFGMNPKLNDDNFVAQPELNDFDEDMHENTDNLDPEPELAG